MSPGLQKAFLIELKPDGSMPDPIVGVPVQFNPATMKLTISNSTEGGESRGKQARQFLGKSSTVLSLDLIFDTADQAVLDKNNHLVPRSVRELTATVEKYVLPVSQKKKKQAPPKLRFQWGPFGLSGVVDNITIDIDHFAEDGTPLRAKVGLSMKEQEIKFQLPADNQSAPLPGQADAGLPGSARKASTQSAVAIGGETAADFAARVGLDPAAWRGLDIGSGAPLSLDAGQEVGFSDDLSVSTGLGVTAGFEAGVSASLEASVGLEVSAAAGIGISASASFGADVSAGLAVSAAGGVSAAIAQVQTSSAGTAVQQTAQAFNQSLPAGAGSPVQASTAALLASPPPPQLGPPAQLRPSLTQAGFPSASQQAAAPAAPPLPRVDPRAVSFGFGVPLRSQIGSASAERADRTVGGATLKTALSSGDPPITSNPSIPPWVALPAAEFTVDTAGAIQLKKRPQPSCGCIGNCRCKGRI